MTPFSGISLILHLAIIGVAKVYYYITGEAETRTRKARVQELGAGPVFNRALSCVIVLAILVVMLSSFGRAVKTSIREGSNEPQIEYIKEKAASLKRVQWASIFWPAEADNGEQQNNAPANTPTSGSSTYTFSK